MLELPGDSDFLWATGIEDTFIAAPAPRTGRILDEYALTQHYERWEEDLRLIADLGVRAARYGIPWYRVCPAPGRYDWSWTDRVLDRMVNTHHVEPIVDLVHYGTPLWMARSFGDPDYPRHVADYARAFAEHYRGLCGWYTPLNEPRVNAWYAGRLGWWPPHGRSWQGFADVLVRICRGICLTHRAILDAEPRAVLVHVDATDLYVPAVAEDPVLVSEAEVRQQIVFLALDLVMGRVDDRHALAPWLRRYGHGDADLAWFRDHAVQPHIIGCNMYPMYSRKVVRRAAGDRLRVQIRACWTETLADLLRMYADRYAPIPVMVAETANRGTPAARCRWIADSAAAVRQVRSEGRRIVGYTYWPLFSLVAWAWQNATGPVDDYLLPMGLWDLRPSAGGLERVRTAAADAYRGLVRSGGW